MQIQQFQVQRSDLRRTRIVSSTAAPLADGEVRVAIDKFGLTANNVSYAVSGDMIGYWKYFPAEGEWGIVPAWGFGNVVESRCAELPVGERLWGFFPMASHVTLQPGKVNAAQFIDFAPHRKPLPGLYNQYHRTLRDPMPLAGMEDERCLLFPLFATSFVIYDYLVDNAFFGAEQVLIGSASSKTGFGLAHLLHHDRTSAKRVVGLTSPGNIAFVQGLELCDQVVAYGNIATLDAAVPTAFVDMAGSGAVIAAVHEHFADRLKLSSIVGATHWEADRKRQALPGPKPAFFFAPSQIAKREKEWGPGAVMLKAFGAGIQIAQTVKDRIEIARAAGTAAVQRDFLALINNEIPPSRGLMLSLQS